MNRALASSAKPILHAKELTHTRMIITHGYSILRASAKSSAVLCQKPKAQSID